MSAAMKTISDLGPYELDTGISPLTRPRQTPPLPKGGSNAAFTLVEMLVAVGLVVLMMTLFATIFQMATGAMSTQKGLAENDQRVRVVVNKLRNDLNGKTRDLNDPNRPYRTFRNVIPFGPDEKDGLPTPFADRNGYLYISENDPNDDTDDVLGLTVYFPSGSSEQFFGRAAVVFPDSSGNYGPAGGSPNPNYPNAQANYPVGGTGASTTAGTYYAAPPQAGQQYYPNQPEFDDIQGTPNGAGDSQFAEVCYFLRRGTLYRRVMLIRQPNVVPKPQDGTPTTDGLLPPVASATLSLATYSGGVRNFWTDFDYSAYFDADATSSLRFHATGNVKFDSLTPGSGAAKWDPPAFPWIPQFNLGNPAYRFGFDTSVQTVTVNGNSAIVPAATYGQPREFITTPAGATPPSTTFFIGRFTHAETSDPTFGYPGN